ncbi:MAG: metal-dependent transcriptional regulator [Sulfobacillus sp.]
MISQTREDYLAAIYRVETTAHRATTGAVARRLGVSAASASAMFHKMADAGLVRYREYLGVTLTATGRLQATQVVRRHRLTERFLTDMLGIGWDRVDKVADQMEHALPEEVTESFARVLGDAARCPHGYPIPSVSGEVAVRETVSLAQMALGGGHVAWVSEDDPVLLADLARRGLVPGAHVQVLTGEPGAKRRVVRVAGRPAAGVQVRLLQAVAVEVEMDARP